MSPELKARIQAQAARVAAEKQAMVANIPAPTPVVANTSTRHGKHADPEKRKAYMRDLMRKKRAAKAKP